MSNFQGHNNGPGLRDDEGGPIFGLIFFASLLGVIALLVKLYG